MKGLSSSGLAELLEKGFEGDVQFEGVVYGRVNGVHPSEANNNCGLYEAWGFYEARGRFLLSAPTSCMKSYDLKLKNADGKTIINFRFEKRKDAKVSHSNDEKYGSIILVPITINENAFIQIEPRGKILF